MTISISIYHDNSIAVTRTPSWLGRLFGRTVSIRAVKRTKMREVFGGTTDPFGPRMVPIHGWLYTDTGHEVERHVYDAIERAITLRAVKARRESLVRR